MEMMKTTVRAIVHSETAGLLASVHFIFRQKVPCRVTFHPTCYTHKIWLYWTASIFEKMLNTVKKKELMFLKLTDRKNYLFTTDLYLKNKTFRLTWNQ